MKAVILIGGRGTRLRPLTLATPKPLLPVVNKPFLRYQLEVLRGRVDEVILCAADPAPFEKALGRSEGGVKLRYVSEARPLGTGGAVRNAAPHLEREKEFLVLNGDVLHNLDVAAFVKAHHRGGARASIALTRVFDPSAYGLVEPAEDGRIERFVEKPSPDEASGNLINAGAYLFQRSMLDAIPPERTVSLEREVFPAMIASGSLRAWESKGYWIDIGTLERYLQVHLDLLGGRTGLPLPSGAKPSIDGGRVSLGAGSQIDETARFSGNVTIGARCRVGPGAILRDCIILEDSFIGGNARVERCIVGPGCRIGERAQLVHVTALAGGSRIEAHSSL